MNPADEVREVVRRLNDAWIHGRMDELAAAFHPDVVVVAPNFVARAAGREACVRGYADFVSSAVLHRVDMEPPEVDVVGNTAVAACPYEIDYTIEGKRWRGGGRDLLVLVREDGAWTVAWRLLMAGPEEEVRAEADTAAAEPPAALRVEKIMPELPVDDVAAAVAHYRDVLGFSVNYQQHDIGVMDRGAARVLLIARTPRHAGIGSCYVYVSDADALHAELTDRGAHVQGEPVSRPWGLREFAVLDPDGNRITFGQPFE
jgi:uncharacterized protein (TIGR02246 family)